MSLPEFRFNRRAYDGGNFVGFAGVCDFCGCDNKLLYKGSIYVVPPEPSVCDECIAAGRLAEKYGSDHPLFGDFDMDDADPQLREEVFTRTPGFPTFNPFNWPVIDRQPLVFVGYGQDAALFANSAAREAMAHALRETLGEELGSTPSPYLLVFKQIDGDRYACWVDLD